MSQLLGRQDANNKVALKAGVWYVISSILVKMISVISTPIFTRLMSTDEYGVFSTFSSWYSLFLVVYTLDLNISIGRAKIDYPDKLDDYIGSMQTLSLVFSLLLSAVMFIFIQPLSEFFELPVIATALLLIYLIASPVINFFQSGYRYKYQYKQNMAIAWYTAIVTVGVSLALIFLIDYNNAILRMIGLVAANVVLAVIFWVISIKNKHVNFNLEYWKYSLKISLPMIFHSLSLNLLSQSNRIIITKFIGMESVALYSLVQNYAALIMIVTDAINQGWQPWFHDNFASGKEEVKKNANLLSVFICYVGLACVAMGPEAVFILGGEQYADAVVCVFPLVMCVICQCLYSHYINVEINQKKTQYAALGTITAAILNVGLNIVLVPIFGYEIAAYVTFGCYCLLLVLHCLITRLVLKIKIYNDRFIFGAMIVTALIAWLLTFTYQYTVLRWIVIAVGFISFLIVFRKFIINFFKNIKKKVKEKK